MLFALSKIFWWIASPGNLIVLWVTLGTLAALLGRRRTARSILIPTTVLCLSITFLPLRGWLLAPLEDRFPAPQTLPEHVDGVIVLGGSIDAELSEQRHQPAISSSGERLIALADLSRRYPQAKLVFTGGSASLFDDHAREADIARDVFAEMGVPVDRVIYERESRNTYENAEFSKILVHPEPGEIWLLITSAYHMPRSVGIFRKIGWQVVPYPVDYGVPPGGGPAPDAFLDGLEGTHWALREWFGLVFYYAAGRTDSLFPGPNP
jgi:uncharacterized SAM-binding protein YcdF (DUF218 family)